MTQAQVTRQRARLMRELLAQLPQDMAAAVRVRCGTVTLKAARTHGNGIRLVWRTDGTFVGEIYPRGRGTITVTRFEAVTKMDLSVI
jgi:hypothetical protein